MNCLGACPPRFPTEEILARACPDSLENSFDGTEGRVSIVIEDFFGACPPRFPSEEILARVCPPRFPSEEILDGKETIEAFFALKKFLCFKIASSEIYQARPTIWLCTLPPRQSWPI